MDEAADRYERSGVPLKLQCQIGVTATGLVGFTQVINKWTRAAALGDVMDAQQIAAAGGIDLKVVVHPEDDAGSIAVRMPDAKPKISASTRLTITVDSDANVTRSGSEANLRAFLTTYMTKLNEMHASMGIGAFDVEREVEAAMGRGDPLLKLVVGQDKANQA